MLYKATEATSCDDVRVQLFKKVNHWTSLDALPPTTDAMQFHIERAHYQSMVWMKATNFKPVLPSPGKMGWIEENGQLSPKLVSLPHIPKSYTDIVSCGCTKGCKSQCCTCRKGKLICTGACKCGGYDCMNIA